MYNLNTGITFKHFFPNGFHRHIHSETYSYMLTEFFILALQLLVNTEIYLFVCYFC